MSLITWNMQGGKPETENKWQSGVFNLMANLNPDIICLQECGAAPGSAKVSQSNFGGISNLTLYELGTERTKKYLLYYPWDTGGNRCNLAIVSKTQPQSRQLLLPSSGPTWRPAVGADYGGRYVFTIHAISPNGPDAKGLLERIDGAVSGWIAAGDFNRSPGTSFPSGNWTVCPPNRNTRPATNPSTKLDYAVVEGTGANKTGQVIDLYMSDHLPVYYS